jgi:hypothetical protein
MRRRLGVTLIILAIYALCKKRDTRIWVGRLSIGKFPMNFQISLVYLCLKDYSPP